ncbi:hypothetical protein F503_00037 [Ophiostoma piceae UAMH 11346]|uniref:Uncharacterized protein n=1 Tax=Ophiostoma piceae (strain UAMH 11346) TaxID=1262450 RepID=S3CF02_OPHP1|nr:hypothetical protein F503_00037 [Ophiostoma piceae UAMH 11346]
MTDYVEGVGMNDLSTEDQNIVAQELEENAQGLDGGETKSDDPSINQGCGDAPDMTGSLTTASAAELLRKHGAQAISLVPNPWFGKVMDYFFEGFGSILAISGMASRQSSARLCRYAAQIWYHGDLDHHSRCYMGGWLHHAYPGWINLGSVGGTAELTNRINEASSVFFTTLVVL